MQRIPQKKGWRGRRPLKREPPPVGSKLSEGRGCLAPPINVKLILKFDTRLILEGRRWNQELTSILTTNGPSNLAWRLCLYPELALIISGSDDWRSVPAC